MRVKQVFFFGPKREAVIEIFTGLPDWRFGFGVLLGDLFYGFSGALDESEAGQNSKGCGGRGRKLMG